MDEAKERAAAFLADMVELCRKHRAMVYLDGEGEDADVEFVEQPIGTSGYMFSVGIAEIEEAVRRELWKELYDGEL
jgi:hypothetical protein